MKEDYIRGVFSVKCRMHKENGIEIELTAAELQSLDITYEKLDYANIETRRVLWTVLDEALGTLGREMDLSGRMLIEAQPVGDGGCILDFTVLPDTGGKIKRRLIKKEEKAILFETEDTDILTDVLRLIRPCVSGKLFRQTGVYRLLLQPCTQQRERLLAVLTEFGDVREVGAAQAASVAELSDYLQEFTASTDAQS